MKKLLPILSALLITSTALACPKTGGIMNGAASRPATLTAECGVAWGAFKGSLNRNMSKPLTFAELYTVPNSTAGSVGGQIEARIKSLGYTRVMSQPMENGYQFGFINLATQRMVIVQVMAISGRMYVSILGMKS